MTDSASRNLRGESSRVTLGRVLRWMVGALAVVSVYVVVEALGGETDHWRSARAGAQTLVVFLVLQYLMGRWLRRRADKHRAPT